MFSNNKIKKRMINIENFKKLLLCLDEYMINNGKEEINEMEANRELALAGILEDDDSHPGRPLRNLLRELRDDNRLPQNIRQRYGAWKIIKSCTMAKGHSIFQFG